MPGKILGVDINEDSVTAVQIKSGLKGYQVTSCGRVLIDGHEGPLEALKELSQQVDFKSDTYFASISGEHISFRNLQMPFREQKKIRQTLPYEIETVVPFTIDDLVVDFSMIDRAEKTKILAASVKKSTLSEYITQLRTCGIDPQVMDIRCVPTVTRLLKGEGTPDNGLFLEIGTKRITMILFIKRRTVLVRTFASGGDALSRAMKNEGNGDSESPTVEQIESEVGIFCSMVQNTIHAFKWLNNQNIHPEKIYFTGPGALYQEMGSLLNRHLDMPVEQINLQDDQRIGMEKEIARIWNAVLMDNALALALREEGRTQGFDFRKGEFEIKKQYIGLKKELRTWTVFLIIIFAILAADLGAEYYFVKKRYGMLEQSIMEVFKQTFPEVKRVVEPVQQMQVKINEIKASSISIPGMGSDQRVLDLLKDISERVPQALDVYVTSMVVDPETVRISGETDTFNTVDSLKNGLEPSTYFSEVTITAANLNRSGKKVQFELKLQRTR
jgi:Tfp pilus assembly PilM family ATPase/Tfp pilus assembly protein PilN